MKKFVSICFIVLAASIIIGQTLIRQQPSYGIAEAENLEDLKKLRIKIYPLTIDTEEEYLENRSFTEETYSAYLSDYENSDNIFIVTPTGRIKATYLNYMMEVDILCVIKGKTEAMRIWVNDIEGVGCGWNVMENYETDGLYYLPYCVNNMEIGHKYLVACAQNDFMYCEKEPVYTFNAVPSYWDIEESDFVVPNKKKDTLMLSDFEGCEFITCSETMAEDIKKLREIILKEVVGEQYEWK